MRHLCVLPGFLELPLLHALSHVPVNKSALRVHQIKLVVQPRPCLRRRFQMSSLYIIFGHFLWRNSNLKNIFTSAMAVVFESIHTERGVLAYAVNKKHGSKIVTKMTFLLSIRIAPPSHPPYRQP
jgi:hypothetical protein